MISNKKTLPFGNNKKIFNWKQFACVRKDLGCTLLSRLDNFKVPILVAGVQRSGTTILARVISQSEGMVDYWTGKDDELDAALILSGYVDYTAGGRHCFQTTYLNECMSEYVSAESDFKLVWVVRNPYSVIQSMVYNWKRFALNELYQAVGIPAMGEDDLLRTRKQWYMPVSTLRKACWAYKGKASQALYLKEKVSPEKLIFIDYDQLVMNSDSELMKVYSFVELPYIEAYSKNIHAKSVKSSSKFNAKEKQLIDEICGPTYSAIKDFSV